MVYINKVGFKFQNSSLHEGMVLYKSYRQLETQFVCRKISPGVEQRGKKRRQHCSKLSYFPSHSAPNRQKTCTPGTYNITCYQGSTGKAFSAGTGTGISKKCRDRDFAGTGTITGTRTVTGTGILPGPGL